MTRIASATRDSEVNVVAKVRIAVGRRSLARGYRGQKRRRR